jgi:hypothetical protein
MLRGTQTDPAAAAASPVLLFRVSAEGMAKTEGGEMRRRLLCLSWGHVWCDLFNQWGNRRAHRCDRCDKVEKIDDQVCVRTPGFKS